MGILCWLYSFNIPLYYEVFGLLRLLVYSNPWNTEGVNNRQTNLSSFQERERLQRDLLTVEKAATENHKQARTLQEQLSTISQELLCLKDTVQTENSIITHHICCR